MKKIMRVILLGLFFYSVSPVYAMAQGGGYENKAVVSFYSEEKEKDTNESITDEKQRLPQTGSEHSSLGIYGGAILLSIFYVYLQRKRTLKKEQKE